MTICFPTGKFSVIYADPPWSFRSWSDKGRNRCPDALVRQKGLAERHYKVMSLDDIKALPVGSIAAEDSALFLWTVDCHLPEALAVGETWGFRFKTTSFTWCKTTQSGGWHIGLGYWTRGDPEQCLLFTRGAPRRRSAAVRQGLDRRPAWKALGEACRGVRAHRDASTRSVPIEVFARHRRPGWTCWGDQLEDAA